MLGHEQIRRRIFLNSGIMAASRGVSAAVSLVMVAVVTAKLGMTGFGTWEVIFSVAIFCSMLQSATINTMLWQVSNAYGLQNENKVRRLLQIGISITLAQFLVITPIVWIFRRDLVTLFHVPQSLLGVAALTLPIFCGMMILNGINECIGAVISGYQRTGLVTMVQSLAQVLNYFVSIGCLFSGLGILSMFIGYTVNYLFAGISYLVIAGRYCPRLRLLPVVLTRQEIKELYGYFSLMVVGTLSGVLRDEKDKLVLTTLFSPKWTAYYSISLRLIGFITLMNSFFYIPVVTAVGALNARGDWESIKRIYSNTIGIVAVTVGFTAVIIAGLHEQLLVLWIGKNIPEVGVILLWLVLGNITAILLVGPGAAICKGIGRLGMEAGFWVIGILINMILTLILIKTYGALGSVAASSLSWAVAAVFFLWFLHRNIALPWRFSLRSIRVLIIVTFSVVLVRIITAHWAIGVNRSETLWVSAVVALVTFVGYQALLVIAKIIPLSVEPFLFLLNRKNNYGRNISQSA